MEATGTEVEEAPRHRGHARVALALIVLGSLLLPIAGLSLWSRRQLLDTNRYVDTMTPLAANPEIQAALADRITTTVLDVTDLETRAKDALPDKAKFLAAPIATAASTFVHDIAAKFIASPEFQKLWVSLNRTAHEQVVAILEGKTTPGIERSDGQVVLVLGPVVEEVLKSLDNVVPVDLSKIPADRINVRYVLVDSADLATVQSAVDLFTKLTYVLIALSIACLVAGGLLTPDRRRGLQRVGTGMVVSMGVTLVLYNVARSQYLGALPSDIPHPDAAAAVFDIATRYVGRGIRFLLFLGVVLFFAAWIPGPSKSATWLRTRGGALIGRGSQGLESGGQLSGTTTFVAAHRNELRGAVVALAVLLLLLWDKPTGKVVVLLAVLVGLGFVVVQLLGGAAAAAPTDAADGEGPMVDSTV